MTIESLSIASLGLAFAGGVVSFVSPCVLPLVPIYLGHLSGVSVQNGKIQGGKTTFLHSIAFVVGFSIVFIALGATVGLLGGTAGGYDALIARVAGVVLIVFGLYMAGAFRLPVVRPVLAPAASFIDRFYYREVRPQGPHGERPSYWKSAGVGSAFAVGWTPCITPVLGAILTLAYNSAAEGTAGTWSGVGKASLLLTFYAAGLSIPFLLAGAALGQITLFLKKMNRFLPIVTIASGLLLVIVGLLIFFNSVTELNRYFDFLPYVDF